MGRDINIGVVLLKFANSTGSSSARLSRFNEYNGDVINYIHSTI